MDEWTPSAPPGRRPPGWSRRSDGTRTPARRDAPPRRSCRIGSGRRRRTQSLVQIAPMHGKAGVPRSLRRRRGYVDEEHGPGDRRRAAADPASLTPSNGVVNPELLQCLHPLGGQIARCPWGSPSFDVRRSRPRRPLRQCPGEVSLRDPPPTIRYSSRSEGHRDLARHGRAPVSPVGGRECAGRFLGEELPGEVGSRVDAGKGVHRLLVPVAAWRICCSSGGGSSEAVRG